MSTFKKWLKKSLKSNSLKTIELDFAEDVMGDKTFIDPKSMEHLVGMLSHKRACREALEAAKLCYQKWQLQDPKATMDGFSPKDKERVRKATRQVWGWHYSRKLCVARATDGDGFARCEQCKKRVPKIFVDHIKPVGKVDRGYLERLFVPSDQLQALCAVCHAPKTKAEAQARSMVSVKTRDFTDDH